MSADTAAALSDWTVPLGRGKQRRSVERRTRIIRGAIEVLATHGIPGLTHRLVARRAGVSLAATTYYYETRFDIIADASRLTLHEYAEGFRRVRARAVAGPGPPLALGALAVRLLQNAAGRDLARTTCLAEIVLDAPRHAETLHLARSWFAELASIWPAIAGVCGEPDPAQSAASAIDTVIGLVFMVLGLGLSADQVGGVLSGGADPLAAWRVAASPAAHPAPAPRTARARHSRERVIEAAIAIAIAEGPAAVRHRTVAAAAGMTAAGPGHHFPTIADLLAAVRDRLFEESKARYRAVAAELAGAPFDLDYLVERTAINLAREATDHAGRSVANYAVWLQAAREPGLRPLIWTAVEDQYHAWHKLLNRLSDQVRPVDPLLCQALFIGKLIRILATGAPAESLARAPAEFAADFASIIGRRFWL